jgi:thioesterase domain-containing protein/3-oxoacyl-(acyl-carrier-protein) synthase/acyl carrier protein/ubiquinone/menaquinone biosynthesis C-methylase UbiE
MEALWKKWDRQKAECSNYPEMMVQTNLVEATMRVLPDILTGQVSATDIMFPDSSMKLVEGIYKNNPTADFFNQVLADTLEAWILERISQDENAGIRIIEVGAGTGGTSAEVLEKIRPYSDHIREYCYTDISKAFLMHAETEYGSDNTFLTYKIFNVEKSPKEQDIETGCYDAAIATNVLHATKSIRETLRNVKAVLKTKGMLLLNEMTDNNLFTHLTFGLLEGWWLYEDSEVRIPGCPGLYLETWQKVLESEGFRPVISPLDKAVEAGQQIILAESDGMIRQKQIKSARVSRKHEIPAKAVPESDIRFTEQDVQEEVLIEKSKAYLKKIIGETLKIKPHRIDASAPLEEYGIDSILVVQLTNSLRKYFDDISSTLFFEYQTIDALTEHLIEKRKDSLKALLSMEDHSINDKSAVQIIPDSDSKVKQSIKRRFSKRLSPVFETTGHRPSSIRDIAIIGLAGRYPGAGNIKEFRENLKNGMDCITEIPKDRWDHSLYFDEEKGKAGKTYCKWGGFIDDVDRFDPLFFNISPAEAKIMDPQERLFLECVWNLLEGAGYTRESLQNKYNGKVGVFAGAMYQPYHAFDSDIITESALSLSGFSSIANRVSYFFDFQGPSVATDTMCSSAAISIHHACESLKNGDCRAAIAGGVNLTIHPKKYIGLSQTQMLASHPDSRSFGDGDGYLPSEGVGAVLLKPLEQAVRDNDRVFAVIKSTAINHGGRSNGYSVPNPNSQAQLIEDNFRKSKIDPRTITYVEAAANGSALGDPIELAGLVKAFGNFTEDTQFCAIGSVKSNIGHPESASGMAQLSKVILQFQDRQLFPSIKADFLNPNISFDKTPFYLQNRLSEWKRPVVKNKGNEREFPRRATISSFGAGGSNAHMILEEYIPVESSPSFLVRDFPGIAVFSAKTQEGLQEVIRQLHDFVENHEEISLPDIVYTLQVGREVMEYRAAMVVNSRDELLEGMKAFLGDDEDNALSKSSIPVFSGNTKEHDPGMNLMLSGKTGEALIQAMLAEKNMEKIAAFWSRGGKIPWETLYEAETMKRISLPTYPFERRRCWIAPGPVSESFEEQGKTGKNIQNTVKIASAPVKDRIIDIVSGLTGMEFSEINENKPLEQYGFSSILLVQLLQQMQTRIDPLINLEKISDCRTIQDIINVVSATDIEQSASSEMKTAMSITTALHRFPELISLGKSSHGKPVFWFHGGVGGVADYQVIARKSQRPFYGIQARGFMTERAPLHGIQAMAAYYVHIIQSVHPEGPYDLGGYSLGGVLAYEVTRQLQESGHVVDTIVMLDSIITEEFKNKSASQKNRMLQAVNTELLSSILQEPEKIPQTLIHHKDLDTNQDDDLFLRELIAIAIKRGLTSDTSQLYTRIQQNVMAQQAYEMNRYSLLPLPDPQGVTCYYFRNKNRLFMGELEPYFITDDNVSLDHINYWEEWEQQIPYLHIMDVDVSNHMVLLSESKSYETICEFCEGLYSKNGISGEFLDSFKKRTIEKHGHMPGVPVKSVLQEYPDVVHQTENRNISSILGISSENAMENDLMAAAVRETGLSDWGDDDFREPLGILIKSCQNEAKLNTIGQLAIQRTIIDSLGNRLRILEELKRHPEIRNERILHPIFIVSLPRTGTTLLQRLLSMDPSNRSPLLWELLRPAPAPDIQTHDHDSRIKMVKKMMDDWNKMVPDLKFKHEMEAMKPDECLFLLQNSFMTPAFGTTVNVPGYMAWLDEQDMIPSYEYYRLQLQILQFRYPTRRWLLKTPVHMYAMDALLAVFPDACVIQTLRDPAESVPSVISLYDTTLGAYSDHVESNLLSREGLDDLKHMTERYLKARDAADPDRFCDIYYKSLVKDPVATVRKIYEHFGYEFNTEFEQRMLEWLAENRQHKHGKHRYSLEKFGLDQDIVYSALEKYCTRFGFVKE